MPILPKLNVTELKVPKNNFTEYPYDRKPIFRIHFAESILPKWSKIRKIFTKKFCLYEETGKTGKKF